MIPFLILILMLYSTRRVHQLLFRQVDLCYKVIRTQSNERCLSLHDTVKSFRQALLFYRATCSQLQL